MNFDIKYTKYLQIFNFTKIKQVLGIQSWDSIAKALNHPRYKLGRSSKQSDSWDPLVRERNKIFAENKNGKGGCTWFLKHELS